MQGEQGVLVYGGFVRQSVSLDSEGGEGGGGEDGKNIN